MMKAKTPLWTSTEAAAITHGDVTQDWAATGISINTRTLQPGDLFVALVGPNVDGHDYVATAFEKGAVAACVSHRPPVFEPDFPLLVVDDSQQALEDLARAARQKSHAKIIAVTGSVGKTGTKEALKLVLGDQAKTAANEGSLNNQWGVPLSLARLPGDAKYGVMELGMNHFGELTPLSKMVAPHVCLITTVQPAHTEFFKSTSEIAKAKAEIFQGAVGDWVAVLNADITETEQLIEAAEHANAASILTFGESIEADFRVIAYQMDATGSDIMAWTPVGRIDYRIGSAGRHWVENSLGILAAVYGAGGDVHRAAQSLSRLTPAKSRGERFDILTDAGAFALIDESYNASPSAMCAALAVLGVQPVQENARRVAVLGDMLELGDDTQKRHKELADVLIKSGVDIVYLAGEAMQDLWESLPSYMQGYHSATAELLADVVKANVMAGDVVMVKGSQGVRMGHIVKVLKSMNINQTGGET